MVEVFSPSFSTVPGRLTLGWACGTRQLDAIRVSRGCARQSSRAARQKSRTLLVQPHGVECSPARVLLQAGPPCGSATAEWCAGGRLTVLRHGTAGRRTREEYDPCRITTRCCTVRKAGRKTRSIAAGPKSSKPCQGSEHRGCTRSAGISDALRHSGGQLHRFGCLESESSKGRGPAPPISKNMWGRWRGRCKSCRECKDKGRQRAACGIAGYTC